MMYKGRFQNDPKMTTFLPITTPKFNLFLYEVDRPQDLTKIRDYCWSGRYGAPTAGEI